LNVVSAGLPPSANRVAEVAVDAITHWKGKPFSDSSNMFSIVHGCSNDARAKRLEF
jgi:hypothetical protein